MGSRLPEAAASDVDRLRRELRRYGAELLPGAVEELTILWGKELNALPADLLAEEAAARLEEPAVAERFVRPMTFGGQPVFSPLRRVLNRHETELKPGAVHALARRWRLECRSWPLPRIAGEVERRLHSAEYLHYRRDHPSIEDPVRDALARFAEILDPESVEILTQRWGPELLRLGSAAEITEALARRLAQPANAGYFRPNRGLPVTGETMLWASLAWHSDQLRPGAGHELYNMWLSLATRQEPARVAGMVVRLLADPRYAAFLRAPASTEVA